MPSCTRLFVYECYSDNNKKLKAIPKYIFVVLYYWSYIIAICTIHSYSQLLYKRSEIGANIPTQRESFIIFIFKKNLSVFNEKYSRIIEHQIKTFHIIHCNFIPLLIHYCLTYIILKLSCP